MLRHLLARAALRRLHASGMAVLTTFAFVLVGAALVPGAPAHAERPELRVLHHPGVEVDELAALVGTPGRSLWAVADSRPVGYLFGAPSFANQAFLDAFPGGAIPPEQRIFVVMTAEAEPLLALATTAATDSEGGELMITAFSSGLSAGQHATLTAQTAPGTLCLLHYSGPRSGTADGRLEAARADEGGAVFWSWPIDEHTAPGTASATVACAGRTVTGLIAIE